MTETPVRRDRRAERRAATVREILDAAWGLSATKGLTGWPLKEVADAVGMRTPSLYVYFDGKNALYDALFADGYRQLLARMEAQYSDDPPRQLLRRGARLFIDFAVESPARFQLLFLRTIPGFEPTPESYALAQAALMPLVEVLAVTGTTDASDVDLFTAMLTGLASQQISNDPDGDRWRRLVDEAIDRLLPH